MSARNYIKQLAELPTPFYFYDMELLNRTLNKATEASSRYGYKIHYALKSNFDPRIVEAVRRAGMGMDCVSGNEVRMAVENGFAASEIVFAGVGKTDREIEYALGQEIFSFNCESLHELQVINEIAGRMGKKARIALRINPDVDPKTHRYITTGKADNKFGISYDEIDAAIASLEKLANLEIVGLHFHIGSQIRDMQVFETFSKRVFDIKEWFREKGIVLKHLNMGGGLGIDYDDPDREPMPDFETYFDIFHRNLKIDEGQTVHFELGRSLVAQCGELITRALYNKETSAGTKIVIVDAGMTDLIRPALYGAKHKIENLTSATGSEKYTIGGPICESSDIFGRDVELPVTSRGDLLTLRSAGAYGMAMASRYNLQDLPGAVYSDKLSKTYFYKLPNKALIHSALFFDVRFSVRKHLGDDGTRYRCRSL